MSTRLGNTLFLAAYAALIAAPLAILLGVAAAIYRNSLFDRVVNIVTLSSISVPQFFIAYILLLVFAVNAGVFPSLSNISPDAGLAERLWKMSLPAITLVFVVVAHMMRMTRASIVTCWQAPISRWQDPRACRARASSFAMHCRTRWRRSSTWWRSILPISLSASWWCRSCSSIPASGSFWSTRS